MSDNYDSLTLNPGVPRSRPNGRKYGSFEPHQCEKDSLATDLHLVNGNMKFVNFTATSQGLELRGIPTMAQYEANDNEMPDHFYPYFETRTWTEDNLQKRILMSMGKTTPEDETVKFLKGISNGLGAGFRV